MVVPSYEDERELVNELVTIFIWKLEIYFEIEQYVALIIEKLSINLEMKEKNGRVTKMIG